MFFGIGLVKDLSIRKPNTAKTAGGVGIGSTLRRVEKEFGVAERVEKYTGIGKRVLNLVTTPMQKSGAFSSSDRLVPLLRELTIRYNLNRRWKLELP
ncbi:hypothetical protein C6502_04445 [Candidatus Poribacteria bacterium]|nr:MAG: hypothetical protein C6502_04445 [Candidatus Poribacteria bacterium]